jgi:hypothetical protein
MKLFISWSGKRSLSIANFFSDWITNVIQAASPWVSSRDIDSGSIWFNQLFDQLKNTKIGIICVTPENMDNSWMHFEAGALAKSVDGPFVCPIVYGMGVSQLKQPLAQFNAISTDKDGIFKLIKSINNASDVSLEEARLTIIFDKWWPELEDFFSGINNSDEYDDIKPRPKEDIIEEILENTREQLRREQARLKYTNEAVPTMQNLAKILEETQQNVGKHINIAGESYDALYDTLRNTGIPEEILASLRSLSSLGDLKYLIKDIPTMIGLTEELGISSDNLKINLEKNKKTDNE